MCPVQRYMDGEWFLPHPAHRFRPCRAEGQGHRDPAGHERGFGAEASKEIKSRGYSNTGDTLDYVYELEGDTLTIWAGERGSPAYYRGTFSGDGGTLTGAWHYPGGGGYEATPTRIEQTAQDAVS
jgi:hypothetical protein